MKGNDKLIAELNNLLAEELTAINQYMVHAEMCDNWGYEKLAKQVKARAIVEMKHAEALIERILFLEGKPDVSRLEKIHIGDDIPAQINHDLSAEEGAIKRYNQAIKLAVDVGDNVSRDLLEDILEDENDHLDELEAKRDQIAQMGLQNFLLSQV